MSYSFGIPDTDSHFDSHFLSGIRVVLRGKAHAEWKIMKSGERRTVKDDQYLLDDKAVIWGKGRLVFYLCIKLIAFAPIPGFILFLLDKTTHFFEITFWHTTRIYVFFGGDQSDRPQIEM